MTDASIKPSASSRVTIATGTTPLMTGAFSMGGEIYFDANAANDHYEVPLQTFNVGGTGFTYFELYRAPPNATGGTGNVANHLYLTYLTTGVVQQIIDLGASGTLYGHWIHWAWTQSSILAGHFFAALEGFTPGSPTYLNGTTSLGTVLDASTDVNMSREFTDNTTVAETTSTARFWACETELSESQISGVGGIWTQRAVTSAVSAVDNLQLICDDHTAPGKDDGNPGTDWTVTGTFVAGKSTVPSSWNAASTVAGVLPGLTAAMAALETIPSTLGGNLPGLTAAMTVTVAVPVTGTLSASLPEMTPALSVSESIPSTLAGVLPGLTAAMTANSASEISCSVAGVLPGLTAALTALETIPATCAGVLPGLTAALAAAETFPCTLAGVLPGLTAALALGEQITGPSLDASLTMLEIFPCTVAGALPGLSASLTASEGNPCTVAGLLPGLVCAAVMSLENGVTGTLAATLPELVPAFTAKETLPCTIQVTLDELVAAATMSSAAPVSMTIGGVLPGLVGGMVAASSVIPPYDQTRKNSGRLRRSGRR